MLRAWRQERLRAQWGHPLAPVCALGCCHSRPTPTAPLLSAGCSFHSPAVALGDGGRPVAGPGSGPSHCASRMEVMAHALCCPAADLECRVKEHTSLGSAGKVGMVHAPLLWCCPRLCLSLCHPEGGSGWLRHLIAGTPTPAFTGVPSWIPVMGHPPQLGSSSSV